MRILVSVLFAASLFSCVTPRKAVEIQQRKYSANELKEDFILLKNILEANHPSLYWYTPKDSIDWYFNTAINSITDSLTELQFRNKVAWAVSKIRCGHTSVRFSKKYLAAENAARNPIFPLTIKVWDDSLVVLSSAYRTDTIFTRGTIITAINGRKPKEILDSLFQLVNTDGFANNFKNQLISFNFGLHYKNAFGLDSQQLIRYLDSNKVERETIIKNYDIKSDTLRMRQLIAASFPQPSKRQIKEARLLGRRSMTIDTPLNTAYIRLATFSGGKLRRFYRKSFRTIKKQGINNIVFDLRENGGGNIMSATKLIQYLSDHKFKVADTVAAVSRKLKYGNHIYPWFIYRLSMLFTSRKKSDGRYHFGYFERHWFKPKKKNHFDANVYLIQGGYSFSATTLFINAIKDQKNVITIGEETGGGSYGNTAVHMPQIILPTTGLRIVLPLYRLVMDASAPKTGKGITPEILVNPNSSYIRKGIDPKIEKVRELIEENKK